MTALVDSQVALSYVRTHRTRLHQIISDLVRIPSENRPPIGHEGACQKHIGDRLRRLGMSPHLYQPDQVPGITEHPLFWPGRDYTGRTNLIATRRGSANRSGAAAKSLLLSGHIDTVPAGTLPWTKSPWSGAIENGRLYGRGANDMKGGVGISLFVIEALSDLAIELRGDLHFETVVDEEFGGCNGTLAGRVSGYNADAAIITEPSWLRVCNAQRGGRTAHITLRAPSGGGVLTDGNLPTGVIAALRSFLNHLPQFQAMRRATAPVHPAYANSPDPVPVAITRISSGPWGTGEPMGIPEECRIELYWQTMPGESQADIEREFHGWFQAMIDAEPHVFSPRPDVEFPIRWLPGSALEPETPLIRELVAAAAEITGKPPAVAGIEGPCDLFVFHEFGIPAVLWGPVGGNTHAADEFLDLESAEIAAAALLSFVCRWCG